MTICPPAQLPKLIQLDNNPSDRIGLFDWQAWLGYVEAELAIEKAVPAFYFPPHEGRKQFAALLANQDSSRFIFAKIVWGANASDRLDREKQGLLLGEEQFSSFERPKVLHQGSFGSVQFILTTALKHDVLPAPQVWDEIYAEYWTEIATSYGEEKKLTDVYWFYHNTALADNKMARDAFGCLEDNQPARGYLFCPAHGDLAPWNACIQDNKLILFDWERFEPVAPRLLDPYYFALSYAILIRKQQNIAEIEQTIAASMGGISYGPHELLLVQLYLVVHLPKGDIWNMVNELLGLTLNACRCQ